MNFNLFLINIVLLIVKYAFGNEYIYGGTLNDGQGWEDAEALCLSQFNTHLASIHSLSDNAKVASICENGNKGRCWIGLRYSDDAGEFEWTDSTDFDYTNWFHGAPSTETDETGSKIEQCVFIVRAGASGIPEEWADASCSKARKFICNAPDLGQTLCVSGLSQTYKILNGDWKAFGISEDLPYDLQEIDTYSNCIDSWGFNICLYSLETNDGDRYFMYMPYIDGPKEGPVIFPQQIEDYKSEQALFNDATILCIRTSFFLSYRDYVNVECDEFDGAWGDTGYKNIKFSYGECE